ncbi:hypothetical protein PTI98_001006 [Pleurotus ostreatus]|nr:hypothetical protein PTI98_001006 [Pleurotus ostreatus]
MDNLVNLAKQGFDAYNGSSQSKQSVVDHTLLNINSL